MEITQRKPAAGNRSIPGLNGTGGLLNTGIARDKVGARSYRAGETIFGPADGHNRLYIVRQGWVRLYKSLPDGRAITFALLGPNSVASQEHLGSGGSTAEAFVDCVVTEAEVSAVVDLVARAPQLASAIIAGLQRRISQLHTMIEQLLVRDTSMRLAGTLLMLADAFGEPVDGEGYTRITTTVTHQFLANMIGSNRVTVTRKLLDLQAENLIKSLGRNALAVNVPALTEYLREREAKLEARDDGSESTEA